MDLWLRISLIVALGFCGFVIARLVLRYLSRKMREHADQEMWERMKDGLPAERGTVLKPTHLIPGEEMTPLRDNADFSRFIEKLDRADIAHPDIRVVMKEVTSGDPLPAALASPPNIGGEDHLPYAGPNYVEAEELAQEMKGIVHYGTERPIGDLAYKAAPGRVAPDGSIWISYNARAEYGTVTVSNHEAMKAKRFGWRIVGPDKSIDDHVFITRTQ